MSWPTAMRAKVERYLDHRRHAGFELRIEGERLLRFAEFAERSGHRGPLTLDLALRWANASTAPSMLTGPRRLEVLRPFARYCALFEPGTEVPPARLLGRAHRRLTPHIYTESELRELLAATDRLHPAGGLRGSCYRALFGLMAATGLRISEALGLDREDVDLDGALLLIRRAKFGKSRWVPLHDSTAEALRCYAKRRDRECGDTPTNAFFIGEYARVVKVAHAEYAFGLLRHMLGWRARGGHRRPRLHDLRHTFVCRTLQQWYEQGVDIDRNILALSTYLGHAKVTDTYWYVTATPELLELAARRFERFAQGQQP